MAMQLVFCVTLLWLVNICATLDCGRNKVPVTWMDFPPYVFRSEDIDPSETADQDEILGAIHSLAKDMVKSCCGTQANLEMAKEVHRPSELEEQIGQSRLVYPVTRRSQHTILDSTIEDWTFLPVVELSGSFILLDLDHMDNVVVDALIGAWPLALLVLSAAGVAGFIIWFLDRSGNHEEFPKSFLHGGWEGLWWAVVTATTVGYGDRSPRSIPARVFGLTWMLLGIILMSIFTATLVSAIQAEDKVGSDIKGSRIAVVSGSQEERYAFSAGAVPQVFETFAEVLDQLEEKKVDAALVDPYYALYFSTDLDSRNIYTRDIVAHSGVHGILAVNTSRDVTQCFAKYVAVYHHRAFDFMKEKVGSLKSMRGKAAHHTSHKLVGSNMVAIYVTCVIFSLMLGSCCAWEFIIYRPRHRKAVLKDKSKLLHSQVNESLLLETQKDDIHQL